MSTKINAYLYFSKFLATFLDDDSNQIGTETLPLPPSPSETKPSIKRMPGIKEKRYPPHESGGYRGLTE